MDLLSLLCTIGDEAIIEGFDSSKPLTGARAGRPAESVENDDDTVVAMLMKMGLVPGVSVRLVAIGPCGDPLAFDVRGGRVAIGRSVARMVRIRRTHTP